MRLARRKETLYEYLTYDIVITHYFDTTHCLHITNPSAEKLEIDKIVFDTENQAVLSAQDYIEKDLLEHADKEKLDKAIHQSIEKWEQIRHFVETPVSPVVEIVLSDATDECGFCREFGCVQCPVRSKCRGIDRTFARLNKQYDWCLKSESSKVCMTENEWIATFYDIIDDILDFLYNLKEKYL